MPASGKNYIAASFLSSLLNTAYFDKDDLRDLVECALRIAGQSSNRDTDFFNQNVRPFEYKTVERLAFTALRHADNAIINFALPLLNLLKVPAEILPLAVLRPISGSASMAIATDIMNSFGVDSLIGLISSTIMGSTETTLYTIALYTSAVKIKKTRFVLIAALLADFVGMLTSVIFWRIMS